MHGARSKEARSLRQQHHPLAVHHKPCLTLAGACDMTSSWGSLLSSDKRWMQLRGITAPHSMLCLAQTAFSRQRQAGHLGGTRSVCWLILLPFVTFAASYGTIS